MCGPNIYTSRPVAVARVTLRRNANLSTGGTSTDVTDLVHPEVAAMCCRAAAAAVLDVCGIDVRLADVHPVLLTYETLGPVRDLLDGLGATPWAGGTSPDGPV